MRSSPNCFPVSQPPPGALPSHSWEISRPRTSLEGWRRAWGSGSLHVARKAHPSECQRLLPGITGGTGKGVNATPRKNYVENKGSYSCFKTFSQLELRAFNQLPFFFFVFSEFFSPLFYCRFSFLPNICRGGKKLKQREREREKQF